MGNTLQLFHRFLQFIGWLLLLFWTVFGVMLVYSMIDASAFPSILTFDFFRPGFGLGRLQWCTGCKGTGGVYLQEISSIMKVWLLIRASLFFFLALRVVKALTKTVESVKSNATFYAGNIQNFRLMSRYALALAALSSFNFFIQGEDTQFDFTLPFGVVAFALGCMLLAQVFEEGRLLTEDKNSIV